MKFKLTRRAAGFSIRSINFILLLARIVRVICKSPREFFNARKRRRETEGYKALTFGMAAVAAGDKDEATKFSKQADKLLGNPE